jgi:hypothetical protein
VARIFRALTLTLFFAAMVSVMSPQSQASPIFVSLGGQTGVSTNNGAIGTLDPATGAVTIIGVPDGGISISGLTFTSDGSLWGTTQQKVPGTLGGPGMPPKPTSPPAITFSNLLDINPLTGALISSVGITSGGDTVSIADLATQPGTNVIYGVQSANDPNFTGTANLYTINPMTGVATLVGNTGDFFASIAFAPNGTLYMTSADLPAAEGGNFPVTSTCFNDINCQLDIVNPANAQTLASVAVPDFYSALGITTTGMLLAGNGAGDMPQPCTGQFCAGVSSLTFTVGPGNTTFIGNTGLNFVSDIALQPVPEPGSLVLVGIGLLVVAGAILLKRHGHKLEFRQR